MNRVKRTGHSVSTNVIFLFLRCLSDDTRIRIQIVASPIILCVQTTCRSSKVAEPIGSSETGQGAVPMCSGTPVLSESGEDIDGMGMASR